MADDIQGEISVKDVAQFKLPSGKSTHNTGKSQILDPVLESKTVCAESTETLGTVRLWRAMLLGYWQDSEMQRLLTSVVPLS